MTVGSSAAPKWIDLYGESQSSSRLFALGLYEIEGEKLKLCLARNLSPGATRPKGFAAGPSSDTVLLELECYQPSADEARLRGDGTWELRQVIINGEPIPSFTHGRPYLHFSEYECYLYGFFTAIGPEKRAALRDYLDYPLGSNGPGTRNWQYFLDPASQPKKITFVESLPTKKDELQGIYKLEGDQLTIAYHKGAPRPEKFESAAGSGVTLMVLQLQPRPGPGGRRGGRGVYRGAAPGAQSSACAADRPRHPAGRLQRVRLRRVHRADREG